MIQEHTLIEERKVIIGFPRYEVSNLGKVYNIQTGREMIFTPTQNGVMTVGLMYDRKQYRRSVKVLVARAFVEGETDHFNTPILLDNDQRHLSADNIRWRPRWYAWEYTHQVENPHPYMFEGPIVDLTTGEEFETIMEAAMTHGSIPKHVYTSIYDKRMVFPTGERYAFK